MPKAASRVRKRPAQMVTAIDRKTYKNNKRIKKRIYIYTINSVWCCRRAVGRMTSEIPNRTRLFFPVKTITWNVKLSRVQRDVTVFGEQIKLISTSPSSFRSVHKQKPESEIYVYFICSISFESFTCLVYGNSMETIRNVYDVKVKCLCAPNNSGGFTVDSPTIRYIPARQRTFQNNEIFRYNYPNYGFLLYFLLPDENRETDQIDARTTFKYTYFQGLLFGK